MKTSISRIKLFKSCRRAYELKYVEGIIPLKSSEAIETGLSYHSKIEELYRDGAFDNTDLSRESAMAAAYEKYIYPEVKAKAVEAWFEYSLCPAHELIGRVDGVTEDGLLLEHKTTSTDLNSYEFYLDWDDQIPAYMLAYGINKMIYTICRKPTIRQKKDESDEDFYQRMIDWYDEDTCEKIRHITITRTNEELEEFRKHLIVMCEEMEMAESLGRLYRNSAYCRHWNTMCEYAQICNNYDPNESYVNYERSK